MIQGEKRSMTSIEKDQPRIWDKKKKIPQDIQHP